MNNKILLEWMASYVDQSKFNGCSLLISQDNKVLFNSGYGYLDKNKTQPFGSDTILRIFSMTKAIVSTCLLTVLGKEKISTGTNISSFISPFDKCYAVCENYSNN